MFRKKLFFTTILASIAALVALISLASSSDDLEDIIGLHKPCDPNVCTTFATEDIPKEPLSPDGACDCQTGADDLDCHYEFIQAFDCGVDQDDDGQWDYDYYGTDWGIKSEANDYIIIYCNIPTDTGANSIKYWGDPESALVSFYHSAADDSDVYIVSSSTAGTTDYEYGTITSSGQGSVLIDLTSMTHYRDWYALILLQEHSGAALHRIRVCYDPT